MQATANSKSTGSSTDETPTPPIEDISVHGTGDVIGWLNKVNASLAFSSYQPGKLFLIGRDAAGNLSVFHRNFDLCMGVTLDEKQNLYVASLYQIWKLTNILPKGQLYQDFDRLYCPQVSYITGEVNTHDIALDYASRLIFVNTSFNCLSIISTDHSFDVLWKPSFISQLVAEDRCHLNGMAMENGRPRYVTMFAATNEIEGWRSHRVNGGIIIDVNTQEIVCSGLSMPHSPRIYRNRLYVLNSGAGEFGYVNKKTGRFKAITFCPGFTRGLSFIGDYAIVGLSKLKAPAIEDNLPIIQNLKKHGFEESLCGFCIIDLRTGKIDCSLEFSSSAMNFIYDVIPIENALKPLTLGIEQDHIRRAISLPPSTDKEHGELVILENIRQM